MKTENNYKWFIRIGLIIIGLAGILFSLGDMLIPQDGAVFSVTENPEVFSNLVTSSNYKFWTLRGFIGVPLETIGTIALFLGLIGTKREKLAFWGMLLCVLGDLFGQGFFTVTTFIFPKVGEMILNGNSTVSSLAALDDFMPVIGISFIMTYVGLILFAIAIWSSKRFPKWSGIIVFIGFLLIMVDTYAVQVITNALWGFGYLWMAFYSWNKLSLTEK